VEQVRTTEPPLCERPARITALARQRAALHGLYLRELGLLDASGEFELEGAATAASWVRRETGRTEAQAARDVALARRLRSLPVLAEAACAGDLQESTVDLVARAAVQLPEELVAETEPALVEAARQLPESDLRRYLAERIAALAPDRVKDAVESQYERRRMHLAKVGDMHDGRMLLEPLVGERLEATLDALMERDRGQDDGRTRPQRRADALAALLDLAAESPEMPRVRQAVPQLIVIEEADGTAHTTGGTVLSEGQLDLVRCDAVVTPVRVGEGRRPLGVGRSSRSLTRRLWLAVVVRDEHCQVRGCTRGASRCVPHHIVPWRLGGRTDLSNLVLLCVEHHHALHDREIHLQLYDGRVLTPTGVAPTGVGPPGAGPPGYRTAA
jgi:hypothetical protein